jgi:predicted transcriptional regulator
MDEQLEQAKIAELTTEIVAAYVSSHKLRVPEVPDLINAVGAELAALGGKS